MTRLREEGTPSSSAWRKASQYLAIPLGGLAPAHHHVPPAVRAWRRHGSSLLTVGGVVFAAVGVLLVSLPRAIPAYADASRVQIGSLILDRASTTPHAGYTLYRGDAVVLLSEVGLRARAAGAASVGGQRTAGRCAPISEEKTQTIDDCTFTVGSSRLTSRDVFDVQTRVWRRSYSDGRVAAFQAMTVSNAIPVPLPLGR